MEAPCNKCGTPVLFEIGEAQFKNYEHVTVCVVDHSGQTICPECGTVIRPYIAGAAGFALAMIPVPPEEVKSIIQLPGGSTN
jgi:hypothetical protein